MLKLAAVFAAGVWCGRAAASLAHLPSFEASRNEYYLTVRNIGNETGDAQPVVVTTVIAGNTLLMAGSLLDGIYEKMRTGDMRAFSYPHFVDRTTDITLMYWVPYVPFPLFAKIKQVAPKEE